MDPNNNQQVNTNPLGQAAAPQPITTTAPVVPAQPAPVAPPQQPPTQTPPVTPVSTAQSSKSGRKKGIILLIILLILILGIAFYVFFVRNQINSAKKASTENTSTVIPTAAIAPTAIPASVDEINIESPDADLNSIEADLQGL